MTTIIYSKKGSNSAAAKSGEALTIKVRYKQPQGQRSRLISRTVSELGGLNILINNAQEVPRGPLDMVTDESFQAGFESGPLATFRLRALSSPARASGRARPWPRPEPAIW